MVLVLALAANILVYPMMMFFLKSLNGWLVRWNWYRKSAFWVAKRAIKGSADKINKYGYVGLALFVMVPLPGTGVYVGSIVAYIFKMDTKKAFAANAIGITISSLIVWGVTCLSAGLL